MDRKKLLLIVNPCSGKKRYNDDLLEVNYSFSKLGFDVTVLNTGKRGDATDFAKRFANDYDIVVCRGGDGTFCEMLSGIMQLKHKPPVGFLPAGTTNDLAGTLGLPIKPAKTAELIAESNPLPLDIGCIDGKYFTYVASFGALTECSYATPQSLKNKFGRLAYFMEGAKEIKDIHSIPLRIVVDGEVFEDEYVFGAVSNSRVVGGVINLDRSLVNLSDGKYEVVFAKNPGTARGWFDMMTSVLKKNFDKRYITVLQGSSVQIKTLDGQPLPWTLDGEYGGDSNDVDIKITKHAFTMFRPVQPGEVVEGEAEQAIK